MGPGYDPAMERDALIRALSDLLTCEPPGIAAAYLFGSCARDEARADSDVDVGVLFVEPPPPTLGAPPRRLEGRLEQALGRPVQVIVLNDAPPDLVHRVMRDGVLLCEPSGSRPSWPSP